MDEVLSQSPERQLWQHIVISDRGLEYDKNKSLSDLI